MSTEARSTPCTLIAFVCMCLLGATLGRACAADSIPDLTSLVVDDARVLTKTDQDALLARLEAFQNDERAQIAIFISKDADGAPLADYALRVAEKWQLGRAGRDDGLLIVIIPSANVARLEVGYGLEGVIPDARASRWIDELLPAVKNQRIDRGRAVARGTLRIDSRAKGGAGRALWWWRRRKERLARRDAPPQTLVMCVMPFPHFAERRPATEALDRLLARSAGGEYQSDLFVKRRHQRHRVTYIHLACCDLGLIDPS